MGSKLEKAQIMFGFWGKSIHGNKGVNSAGLALIAGQFF
jgi:hypothetical protein